MLQLAFERTMVL